MKTKILVTLLAAGIMAGCGKDKYNTKPTLTLKSINHSVVPFNGTLVVEFEVTDKEGDIADSFYVKKVRINKRVVPTKVDAFNLRLPSAPNTSKSFVSLTMDYNGYLVSAITPPITGTPPKPENDTLIFKFALKDKAKNVSDTFITDPIVVTRM